MTQPVITKDEVIKGASNIYCSIMTNALSAFTHLKSQYPDIIEYPTIDNGKYKISIRPTERKENE